MFAFVGKNRYHDMPLAERLCYFQRGATCSSRGDSNKHSFFGREPPRISRCLFIGDGNDFVDDLAIEHGRNKTGADSLNFMKARLPAGDHR